MVAGVQLYIVNTTALSQWKGGGFGMYTTPHPNYTKVVVDDTILSYTSQYSLEMKNLFFYPNKKNTDSFLKLRELEPDSIFQTYLPSINVKENYLIYDKPNYEISYSKN